MTSHETNSGVGCRCQNNAGGPAKIQICCFFCCLLVGPGEGRVWGRWGLGAVAFGVLWASFVRREMMQGLLLVCLRLVWCVLSPMGWPWAAGRIWPRGRVHLAWFRVRPNKGGRAGHSRCSAIPMVLPWVRARALLQVHPIVWLLVCSIAPSCAVCWCPVGGDSPLCLFFC